MEAQRKSSETGNVYWGWPDNDATSYSPAQFYSLVKPIETGEQYTAVAINSMRWVNREEDARSGITATPSPIDLFESQEKDENAEDRTTLLSKKYASSQYNLSREENARLQILNHTMDLETSRYTSKDWEALDEAQQLIEELGRIQGD